MDSAREDKPVFVACSITLCKSGQMLIEVCFEGLLT
jgi:hypothetical protein